MAPFQRRFREIAGGSRQISTIRIPQRKLINSFGTISRLISLGAPFDVPRISFVSSKLLARKLSVSVERAASIEGRSRVGRSCFSERCINFVYDRIRAWWEGSQSCFTLDVVASRSQSTVPLVRLFPRVFSRFPSINGCRCAYSVRVCRRWAYSRNRRKIQGKRREHTPPSYFRRSFEWWRRTPLNYEYDCTGLWLRTSRGTKGLCSPAARKFLYRGIAIYTARRVYHGEEFGSKFASFSIIDGSSLKIEREKKKKMKKKEKETVPRFLRHGYEQHTRTHALCTRVSARWRFAGSHPRDSRRLIVIPFPRACEVKSSLPTVRMHRNAADSYPNEIVGHESGGNGN